MKRLFSTFLLVSVSLCAQWNPLVSAHANLGIQTWDSFVGPSSTYTGTFSTNSPTDLFGSILSISGITGPAIQSAGTAQVSGMYTAISQSFSMNVTAGSSIVVDFGSSASFPLLTATVTDTLGNVYVQYPFGHISGVSFFIGAWVSSGVSGGTDTVTVTLTGFGTPTLSNFIAIHEYPGFAVVNSFPTGFCVGPCNGSITASTVSTGNLLHYFIGSFPAYFPIPVGGPGAQPAIVFTN